MLWRIVLVGLAALAIGAAATLLAEGTSGSVRLHIGSLTRTFEESLWLFIATAFFLGALLAAVIVGLTRLGGPFLKITIGAIFVLGLCAIAIIFDSHSATTNAALLVGLLSVFIALAWEQRVALGTLLTNLTNWVQGYTQVPPVIAPPPVSAVLLVLLILLAPSLIGSTILVRATLVLGLTAGGIAAAWRATSLVRAGKPIEVRARYGGLGGGQGGWRLSQPASLLLIAIVLLAAAAGLAQFDRPAAAPRNQPSEVGPRQASPRPNSTPGPQGGTQSGAAPTPAVPPAPPAAQR